MMDGGCSISRIPTIALLTACLPNAQEIMDSEEDDKYVWFPEPGRGTGVFSASDTWRAMNPYPIEVFWHEVMWFTGRIPKHAFIIWVAAKDRMVTRDRLIRWGLSVPSTCFLCTGHDECRQHSFFDCAYSNQIWAFFVSQLNFVSPQSFEAVFRWLKAPSRNKNVTLIIRLIHQAVLYLVWKERNKRIHTAVEKPPRTLIAETQQIIKLRLDPLTRRQIIPQGQDSVLAT